VKGIVAGAKEERGVYDTGNMIRGQVQEGMFPPFMRKPTESRELILIRYTLAADICLRVCRGTWGPATDAPIDFRRC
jgi:hypothetical protein